MSEEVQTAVELTPEHPLDRIVDLASRAENQGFDAAFVSSHYFNRDPYQALALIAAETDRMQIGPGVVNPYESHPAVHAGKIATLDEASEGRALYGLGAGDRSTLATLGIERNAPLSRVADSIRLSRRLWAGDVVTEEGSVTTQGASLNLEAGTIPIYVGAQGPQMLRMAATLADGVLVNGSHPLDVSWAVDQIASVDRPREAVSVLAFTSVSVGPDAATARESARPPVAFIVGGAASAHLERHDIDEEVATQISEALEGGELDRAFGLVTPRMIDVFSVAGTVETVANRFKQLAESVDGIVVGSPIGPDLESGVDLAREALERASIAD